MPLPLLGMVARGAMMAGKPGGMASRGMNAMSSGAGEAGASASGGCCAKADKNHKQLMHKRKGIRGIAFSTGAMMKKSNILSGMIGIVMSLVEMIFTVVLLPLLPPVIFTIKLLAWVIGLITPIFVGIFKAVNWVFEKIGSYLFPALEKFKGWVHAGWDWIVGWLKKIDWGKIWQSIKDFFWAVFNPVKSFVETIWNWLSPHISKISGWIMEGLSWLGAAAGWALDIFQRVWGWVKSFFSGILDFGWLKSIRDFILDKVAWFLELISGIDFKWFGGKVFSDAGNTAEMIRTWLDGQKNISGSGTSANESLSGITAPTVNISVVSGDLQENQEIKIATEQVNKNNEQDIVRIDGLASMSGF